MRQRILSSHLLLLLLDLHEDQCHGHVGALSNKVGGVLQQRLQQVDGVFERGAGAGDAHSHARAVADVGVERLRQQRHQLRDLRRTQNTEHRAMST